MTTVNINFLSPYLHDFDVIIVTKKSIQILKDYFEDDGISNFETEYIVAYSDTHKLIFEYKLYEFNYKIELIDNLEFSNLQQIKSNYNIIDYISNENETNEYRKSINSRNILVYNILKNNYKYENKYDQYKEMYEKLNEEYIDILSKSVTKEISFEERIMKAEKNIIRH